VTSRPTVEAARSRCLAISRIDEPEAIPREMSSRSPGVRATRERRRALGGIPSTRQQQTANGAMWLVKGAPDLMQRLPGLPSTPDFVLLDRRKSKPFDGRRLNVRQSIWRSHATEPKTAESCNPVPVIDPLRTLVVELRMADGNPEVGPILRNYAGKPLNLDNLAKRIVRPILLAAGLKWHGWYAFVEGSQRWSIRWRKMQWPPRACCGTPA